MKPEKKKQKVVDLNMKLAIIEHLDEGHNIRATVDKFSVSKGTIQAAKENRDLILKEVESNCSLSKARIVKQNNVNVILWRWFATARARGYPINGLILQGKAKQIANKLGIKGGDFSTSEGWLHKWKQHNNVRSYKISGEFGNVDLERAEQWKLSLNTFMIGYDLKNVFNMDETGFFFRMLVDSTLSHVK
jgi:transposase